jgi:hypothetical protein
MQQFYVVLDYGKYQFAINGVYTPISEIKDKGFRDPDRNTGTSQNKVVFIVIAAILIVLTVVGVIGCVIVRVKNKRLHDNLAKYEQL